MKVTNKDFEETQATIASIWLGGGMCCGFVVGTFARVVQNEFYSFFVNSKKSIFEYTISNYISFPLEIGSIFLVNQCICNGIIGYLIKNDKISNFYSWSEDPAKMLAIFPTYLSICYYYGISIINSLKEILFRSFIFTKTSIFVSLVLSVSCFLAFQIAKCLDLNIEQSRKSIFIISAIWGTLINYYTMMDLSKMFPEYANSNFHILITMLSVSAIFYQTMCVWSMILGIFIFTGYPSESIGHFLHFTAIPYLLVVSVTVLMMTFDITSIIPNSWHPISWMPISLMPILGFVFTPLFFSWLIQILV